MDWSCAGDITNKTRLTFQDKGRSNKLCRRHSLEYIAQIPGEVKPKLKAYSVNFLVRAAGCRLDIKSL